MIATYEPSIIALEDDGGTPKWVISGHAHKHMIDMTVTTAAKIGIQPAVLPLPKSSHGKRQKRARRKSRR